MHTISDIAELRLHDAFESARSLSLDDLDDYQQVKKVCWPGLLGNCCRTTHDCDVQMRLGDVDEQSQTQSFSEEASDTEENCVQGQACLCCWHCWGNVGTACDSQLPSTPIYVCERSKTLHFDL